MTFPFLYPCLLFLILIPFLLLYRPSGGDENRTSYLNVAVCLGSFFFFKLSSYIT